MRLKSVLTSRRCIIDCPLKRYVFGSSLGAKACDWERASRCLKCRAILWIGMPRRRSGMGYSPQIFWWYAYPSIPCRVCMHNFVSSAWPHGVVTFDNRTLLQPTQPSRRIWSICIWGIRISILLSLHSYVVLPCDVELTIFIRERFSQLRQWFLTANCTTRRACQPPNAYLSLIQGLVSHMSFPWLMEL